MCYEWQGLKGTVLSVWMHKIIMLRPFCLHGKSGRVGIMLYFLISGESCWWTIHPASKQRSEGEKVRVGDDLILVSVASERYLVISLEWINVYLTKLTKYFIK